MAIDGWALVSGSGEAVVLPHPATVWVVAQVATVE